MSQIIKDLISNYTAGETLTVNDTVYVSDGTGADSGRTAGRVYKLEIGTAGRDKFAGLSKQTVSTAAEVKVITSGRLKGFSGLPLGSVIYADAAAGGYTSTKPSGKVQVLGSTESATVLIVNASLGSASSNLVDGALVGTTDAQDISNKAIIDPSRLDPKKDTKSNLDIYAATAQNGEIVFATDSKLMFQVTDGVLSELAGGGGSGTGSLDTFISEDFETTVAADLTSGKDATFDNAGTLGGNLTDETGSQISGTSSLRYITNSTAFLSDNDFFYLPAHTLDAKQKGQDVGVNFWYNSSIADGSMEVVIWDDTNNVKLNSTLDTLKLSSDNVRFSTSVFIPSTCNVIKVGFHHVGTSAILRVLVVDDIELSTNPFVYKDLIESNSIGLEGNAGETITASTESIPFAGAAVGWDSGSHTYSVQKSDSTINIQCSINKTAPAVVDIHMYLNGSYYRNVVRTRSTKYAVSDVFAYNSFKGEFTKDDTIDFRFGATTTLANDPTNHYLNVHEEWTSEHVIAPLKSKPNTFAARIANNGTASITSQSSEFIQSVNRSATGVVDIVFVPGFFTITPSVIIVAEAIECKGSPYSVTTSGFTVLTEQNGTTNSDQNFNITVTRQGTDYQENFGLSATPTPKIAYLKDVKPSGNHGGDFTSGAWQTRELNTLEGDTSFISLATNQITLQPGKYSVEGLAPAFEVNNHKCKFYNITDSTDDIEGSNERIATGSGGMSSSTLNGEIEITVATTFELQHWCTSTKAANGFGTSFGVGSVDELYATMKIVKLR